tara:strand:- start:379 stop:594 length:216 start_codon:yes stop_codon:yes gene_type:complete
MNSSYTYLKTIRDEKEKCKIVQSNFDNIKKLLEDINKLVVDMKGLKDDVREIKILVEKKEERDMNKWLTWG